MYTLSLGDVSGACEWAWRSARVQEELSRDADADASPGSSHPSQVVKATTQFWYKVRRLRTV